MAATLYGTIMVVKEWKELMKMGKNRDFPPPATRMVQNGNINYMLRANLQELGKLGTQKVI